MSDGEPYIEHLDTYDHLWLLKWTWLRNGYRHRGLTTHSQCCVPPKKKVILKQTLFR